jgi:hypothetical protein
MFLRSLLNKLKNKSKNCESLPMPRLVNQFVPIETDDVNNGQLPSYIHFLPQNVAFMEAHFTDLTVTDIFVVTAS